MQWWYKLLTKPVIKKRLKSIEYKITSRFPEIGDSFIYDLKIKLKKIGLQAPVTDINSNEWKWTAEYNLNPEDKPLVSVIVPNYNHEIYLRERLDSIYGQTYENIEVILLDDCSTDNSRNLLLEYANRYPEKTVTIFNEVNSGGVFRQWCKGIEQAKGKYIWIAESDDYCTDNFLSELVPLLNNESCMLAYAESIFVKNGVKIWSMSEYLSDLQGINWKEPFSITAHMAVRMGFAKKNIIPNVSSVLFRNVGAIPEDIKELWGETKLCGDWLFYLSLIKGGTISYTNKATNYYRIHEQSTSLKIQSSNQYYREFQLVSCYINSNYDIPFEIFESVKKDLEAHYRRVHNTDDAEEVNKHYNLSAIKLSSRERNPNVLICGFSMIMGGGETFPIFLANELKKQGITVTFLDLMLDKYDPEVRKLLNRNIPLVHLKQQELLAQVIYQLGGEIIHSHHGSVDNLISNWITKNHSCKHVITLHGMYEAIPVKEREYLMSRVTSSCSQFVYTAEKNLKPFKELGYIDKTPLIKIGNGLPTSEFTPICRSELGISEDSFVLCLVSRGISEKGWFEAVDAVRSANLVSERPIHLLLIGSDGDAYNTLKDQKIERIHLLGRKGNIRDYFAASDMGFLPTRFPGESFPLVVIDCLMTGKPVIASNVGEIKNQLLDENGDIAGILFELENGKIPVEKLTNIIVQIANDKKLYEELRDRTASAATKFDIGSIAKQYLTIYRKVKEV